MKTSAIILAAGSGSRMQTQIPKQFMDLCGKPVIYYSILAFVQSGVDEIILVTSEPYISYCENLKKTYGFDKITHIVTGGRERYLSVYEGLRMLTDSELVLIHDGARPFITPSIIKRTREKAAECGACVAAMPAKDTIKLVNEAGIVVHTPKRSDVWQVQTPQGFQIDLLMKAYEKLFAAGATNITDDAMVVEGYGKHSICIVEGSYENFKLTTAEDFWMAEALMKKRLEIGENIIDR